MEAVFCAWSGEHGFVQIQSIYDKDPLVQLVFYGPNLKNEKTRRIFELLSAQFALGAGYFRRVGGVVPLTYSDDELRNVKSKTLLLIGQQESLYDPAAAI